MTDQDDAISRRYRGMAREEPPATIDEAILAASRRAVGAGPRRNRWAVPVSLAAVLVLGLGVALRMRVVQPGIETSVPATTSSAEYPVAEPPVAVEPAAPAAPAAVAKDAAKPPPRIAAPARKAIKPADLPPEAVTAQAPAAAAPAAAATPEAFSDLNAQRRAPAPSDARVVELERIARLRAQNRHEEADKALEAFRKQHPQYRIPEALWERVRPR